MTQKDVMQLLIAEDIGAVPSVAAGSAITDYSDLADGEVAVVNSHNIVLSASTVLTDDLVAQFGIRVVQRSGSELIYSDFIKQNNIVGYKGQTDDAGQEQITYIGYDGSSGSINAANSKLYVVRISLEEMDVTGQGQAMILNAPYKSDASATQLEVATGVAKALANALNRQTVKPIKAELIANVAYAATQAFANTCTVVKGGEHVTCATSTDYNTNVDLAVGDYVRFSGAPSTTGCLVSDGIYKVIELTSATQFKVDRPVEVASQTFTAALVGATVLPAADMASANLGIKLTGIERSFILPKYRYSKVRFHVGLDSATSFANTAVNYSQNAKLGYGTYEQIAQLEWDLLGNEGNPYRGDFLFSAARSDAESTAAYDTISINYFGDHSTLGIGGTPRRNKQLVIAFETGFSNGEAPDIVADVLDAYSTQSSGIGV